MLTAKITIITIVTIAIIVLGSMLAGAAKNLELASHERMAKIDAILNCK